MLLVEKRVTTLEEILAQTLQTVEQTSRELREFKQEMHQSRETSEREMQAFKDEMRQSRASSEQDLQAFKEEMRQSRETSEREMQAFKEEMRQSRETSERDMQAFKEEMRQFRETSERDLQAFKNEMRQSRETSEQDLQIFKDEMCQFRDWIEAEIKESQASRQQLTKEMNHRWGQFSQIMGRMAEDLVAPSLPRILSQVLDCPKKHIQSSAVRVKRRAGSKQREFDVVVVCQNEVLINETKNRLRSEDLKAFTEEVLPTVRAFFPEYADKSFIGSMASLSVDEQLIREGEKRGLLILGLGEDLMAVLNTKDFVPKRF